MSKASLSATIVLTIGSMFIMGCATKGYVKKSVQPIDEKVDQVDKASQQRDSQQTAELGKTNQNLDQDERKLSATDEIARTADTTAKGAMAKTGQNAKDIGDLRGDVRSVVANIDDYKPASDPIVVHFGVNKNTLTKDERAKLDEIATQTGSLQRYFITVEGFTDQTGDVAYNDQLSRERANQVISYLVGTHDIPVYRIHMVGLGEQKLVDEGKGRKARAESRRVEITIYSAKPLTVAASTNGN